MIKASDAATVIDYSYFKRVQNGFSVKEVENEENRNSYWLYLRQGGTLGSSQADAEWLLEHQEIIPEECRDKILYFPGTLWGVSNLVAIPYLVWRNEKWEMDFAWSPYQLPEKLFVVYPKAI